jgi:hypothetical protein
MRCISGRGRSGFVLYSILVYPRTNQRRRRPNVLRRGTNSLQSTLRGGGALSLLKAILMQKASECTWFLESTRCIPVMLSDFIAFEKEVELGTDRPRVGCREALRYRVNDSMARVGPPGAEDTRARCARPHVDDWADSAICLVCNSTATCLWANWLQGRCALDPKDLGLGPLNLVKQTSIEHRYGTP